MAPTTHYVAVERPDLQCNTPVLMRIFGKHFVKLLDVQMMTFVSHFSVVQELRWDFQYQEMLDEVFWGKHCWTVIVSNSRLHRSAALRPSCQEIVDGTARGFFNRNVLQAMEQKAFVQVATLECSSWNHSEACPWRVRHLEVKDWWKQEKGHVERTQGLTREVRRQSSKFVDEVLGPRSTSQVDQVLHH